MYYYQSLIGLLLIEEKDGYLTKISLVSEQKKEEKKEIPNIINLTIQQLDEYFLGKRKEFNLDYKLIGTDFQRKVWNALSKVPYGETKTYKEIALSLGNALACRAVGNACHENPILIIIPCHRILGTNGALTGFRSGLATKQKLLDIEKK